jgi:hypothetical protein
VIQAVCPIFIAVVGPQVEVRNDLHLLRKDVEKVFLKERVSDLFERLKIEFGAEMVENRIFAGSIFTSLTGR